MIKAPDIRVTVEKSIVRSHSPLKASRRVKLSDTCSEALTTTLYTAQHLEPHRVCVCVFATRLKNSYCDARASESPAQSLPAERSLACALATNAAAGALSGGALMKYCRRKVIHTAPRIKIYSVFPTFYWRRRAFLKGSARSAGVWFHNCAFSFVERFPVCQLLLLTV